METLLANSVFRGDSGVPAIDAESAVPVEIRSQVRGLVLSVYDPAELEERRCEQRFPFPFLIRISPVGDQGTSPIGPASVVVGKSISEAGLGFYHPKPLPYRRVIATLDTGERRLSLLMDLRWCQFTRHGWYESGGRFLSIVDDPSDHPEI
ncbi:hypothetical protein JCM19992_30640 [Thermostilla marina]